MKLDINNYPGSKNGSGVLQSIFNNLPKTDLFIEGFGGSAKVARELKKKLGKKITVVVCEKSQKVTEQLFLLNEEINIKYVDAVEFYKEQFYKNGIDPYFGNVFFFDPPYRFETRRGKRNLYEHEWTDLQHEHFLKFITDYFHYPNDDRSQMFCMITHPRCELYERELERWFTVDIEYQTRGGIMYDTIWMNYDIAQMELACTDYIGENYTDRQAFHRKKKRWAKRLNELPIHEKQAMLEHIQNNCR